MSIASYVSLILISVGLCRGNASQSANCGKLLGLDYIFIAVIIARLSTTLADVVVLIVTLKVTISSLRNARRVHMKVPIVTALLRDGMSYP